MDWPDTRLHLITRRGAEIVAVIGPEPSLRWKRFCDGCSSSCRRST